MSARRAKAILERMERAVPEMPMPAPQEDPVDWEAVSQRLLEGRDADGLDEPSRRALDDLRPYAEAFREFVRGQEEKPAEG